MMSIIIPREEQPSSEARKIFKAMYHERIKSLRTEGLSSGFDHPGLVHSDTDFTPSPRQEKGKKAMSSSPSIPMSDKINMGTFSTFDRLMMSMGKKRVEHHRALGCNLN